MSSSSPAVSKSASVSCATRATVAAVSAAPAAAVPPTAIEGSTPSSRVSVKAPDLPVNHAAIAAPLSGVQK